jgi:phage/plasmid-associated DNA primase
LPTTPDKSTGFYRRWAITDFPNVFNIKADILSEITEKEYENLCLKCVNILKRLYEIQKFTNEGSYEEREKRFEERSNPLPAFIDDKCDEEAGEKIKLQDFGNKFNEWLKERRLRMMTIKQIGEQLRNAGWTIGNRLFLNEAGTTSKAVINLRWK